MNRKVDCNLALLTLFSLGFIILVLTNDMYPPPLSRTHLGDSEAKYGDLTISMKIEGIDGKRFENKYIITLILRNEGFESYSRDLRQPVFEVYVYDFSGTFVTDWSCCNEMLDLPIPVHLDRGDEFIEVKSWFGSALDTLDCDIKPLPMGRYYIKGAWLGGPIVETGLITVDIG